MELFNRLIFYIINTIICQRPVTSPHQLRMAGRKLSPRRITASCRLLAVGFQPLVLTGCRWSVAASCPSAAAAFAAAAAGAAGAAAAGEDAAGAAATAENEAAEAAARRFWEKPDPGYVNGRGAARLGASGVAKPQLRQ